MLRPWLLVVPASLAAVLAAAGCREPTSVSIARPPGSLWVPDSAAILVHGQLSGVTSETRAVVSDSATWAATWAQVHADVMPQPPLPNVDFAAQVVLVVAQGEQPTGGFSIGIDSLVADSLGTKVYVTAASPGRTCITIQIVTAPAELVLVPRSLTPFAFEDREVVYECQ